MITGIQIAKALARRPAEFLLAAGRQRKAKRAASLQNPALLKMKLAAVSKRGGVNTVKFRWKLNRKYALKAISI